MKRVLLEIDIREMGVVRITRRLLPVNEIMATDWLVGRADLFLVLPTPTAACLRERESRERRERRAEGEEPALKYLLLCSFLLSSSLCVSARCRRANLPSLR